MTASATTTAILILTESLPGGRERFLEEIKPLVAEKIYYSAEDVAERYRVSLSTVKKWRAQGNLTPSLKIPGGTARYTLADLAGLEKRGKGGE